MGDYGLRNKRELWRYKTKLSQIRGIARALLAKTGEERAKVEKQFLDKLVRMGLAPDGTEIDAILDLDIRDLLERRLQTVVFRSGMAKSHQQARQLVSHGHVSVSGKVVSVPGYLVSRGEESKIKFWGQSPIAKSDHPIRKSAATQAAPAPSPPKPKRTATRPVTPIPIRAKVPPKAIPPVIEDAPVELEEPAEPVEAEEEKPAESKE